jgi:hypothetical protein
MYDETLATEILKQTRRAVLTILERFEPVNSVEDFVGSSAGMEKLDSICMLLIAIGESLKNFDKVTNGSFFQNILKLTGKKQKAFGM